MRICVQTFFQTYTKKEAETKFFKFISNRKVVFKARFYTVSNVPFCVHRVSPALIFTHQNMAVRTCLQFTQKKMVKELMITASRLAFRLAITFVVFSFYFQRKFQVQQERHTKSLLLESHHHHPHPHRRWCCCFCCRQSFLRKARRKVS